jgi:2-iminobutanoate/2-iminopropanoate deaminase
MDMEKKIVNSSQAPSPVGPYSQAVEIDGFLYCSGQIALDPKSGEVVAPEDVRGQTQQVMKNIEAVLQAADLTMKNVIKTTIYLTDMADFAAVNQVYGESFPSAPPARSTVAVAGLPKGVSVEIEVLARRF